MLRTFLLLLTLLATKINFAQYDAECFINNKKEVQYDIEHAPGDSIRFQDTITIDNVRRYVDTTMRRGIDGNPFVHKLIGCRLPDFNFFNLKMEDMSIDKIKSDFTIVNFSSTTYGDVSNARMHQFGRLKSLLKDSLTVISIFEESNKNVLEYSLNYDDNIEFVANADLLFYHYAGALNPVIYLLDKYKNIVFVRVGHQYSYTPDEIYSELLDKIRNTKCD